MIYFFDIDLKLKKIVTPENALEAVHEHELNNMILGSVTMDMAYAKAFIDDVDHFGYYWRGNFYLHRIRRVEDSHINETVTVTGRHIFFEDMLYGLPIGDFRPQNRDAAYILKNTIDTNTRWLTVMTDVTGVLSTNFYRQVPWEVIEWVTENFRVEFEPVILFDGQKINGYQLHVANKLGVNKHKRIPFSRVTELDYEIDYSEIITSLAGYGKGEEVGEGYGRRINIADVDFSRNGIVSPLGSHYMEDPNITALYGKDNGEPKYAVDDESFTDIEDPAILADAMYDAYLEMSRPKMVFSASVIDVGDVGIGDTQTIVRPEYDVFYSVRIHKLVVNLHDPDDADVELGDYAHFKESKAERASRRADKAWKKRYESAIQEIKRDWDADFEGMKEQIQQGYEQAVIDANANIDAAEVRMQEELDTQRQQMINNIDQAEQAAKDAAAKNLADTTERINTTIDTTRMNLEADISREVTDAKNYADTQAQAKADSVQSNLDSFKVTHQQMYDAVTADIMNIDEFIGPQDRTLQMILDEQRNTLEEKIETYNRRYPNLVIGTTLENVDGFEPHLESEFELRTDESLNYIRTYPVRAAANAYYYPDTVYLEQGKTYTLAFDFRSDVVNDLDYTFFMGPYSNVPLDTALLRGFEADGEWHRYYVTFDWVDTSRQARLMVGTTFSRGDIDAGWFDTRQVHVYEGDVHGIPWSPSPSDNSQIVSQLLYEMRQLEDGMSTLATKTELNLLDNTVQQFTNEFTSTSEQLSSKLQNYDDALGVNGSHFTQIAEQVQSKVWLNDVTDINSNLIPFADVSDPNNLSRWEMWNANAKAVDSSGEYVVRSTSSSSVIGIQSTAFDVSAGEEVVLSVITRTSDGWQTRPTFGYTYLINENGTNQFIGSAHEYQQIGSTRRRNIWKFTVDFTGKARVLLGTYTLAENVDALFTFKEPKLERGSERTPFMNAFSNIEQIAHEIALQVQGTDGGILTQSDISVQSDRVLIGSQSIGSSTLASIISVSPAAVDIITDEMNLTGNLNVKGQIESISMSAVNANIAELRANILKANVITSDMIGANVITSDKILFGTGLAEDIVASNIVSNHITSRSLEAIEANFGRVQTAILKSNVITSDMIGSNVIRSKHIFVENAMIEDIVNTNLFTNNVKAMSIDAIYADLRSVNSEIMTSNIIKSNWLKVDTALFERFTSSEAFIDRLTVKAANVRDLEAITVDAIQANITTVMNSMGQVEGGLTIRRPDGAYWVRNGIARGHVPVQVYEASNSDEVGFTDFNYFTGSSFWQRIKFFYTPHEGTRLRVTWAVGLYDGPSTIEYMEVRVRTFSGYSPINMGNGTSVRRATITKGETTYITQDIPMPPPEYREMAAYLEFRRAPDGQSIKNRVYARLLFIGQFE